MKIAIIGGGITGLSAAYFLSKKGMYVTVFEKNKKLGGLLKTFSVNGNSLEKYYHHFFNTDEDLIRLLKELNLDDAIIRKNTRVGFFSMGKIYSLSTSFELLRFKPLSIVDRGLLGLSLIYLKVTKNWKRLEKISAKKWTIRYSGKNVYKKIWEPLLKQKFGSNHEKVSAAWIWGRINARLNSRKKAREELLYLKGSFKELVDALKKSIGKNKYRILHEKAKRVKRLGRGSKFIINNKHKFDKIIFTVPNPEISKLFPWPKRFRKKLLKIEYQAVLCVILLLKRPLTDLYWTNITDENIPFGAIIEHTNLINKREYGHNIIYLTKYVEQKNKLMKKSNKEIFKIYMKGLKKIFPNFKREDIKDFLIFKDKSATPIYAIGHSRVMPDVKTPTKGLYILNTSQIYPFDRNINFSIKLVKDNIKNILKNKVISKNKMKLSIILPCYNEKDNIPLLIKKFSRCIKRKKGIEVILVNNGSTDGSERIIERLAEEYKFLKVVNINRNIGYGNGIFKGLKKAKGEFVSWSHADLQTEPKDIFVGYRLIKSQKNPEKSYVKGNRKGRDILPATFTFGMSLTASLLLKKRLYDVNAQPNLFHKDFLKKLKYPPKDFNFDLYAYYIAASNNMKIIRFPVYFRKRIHGVSHWNISLVAKIKFMKNIINYLSLLKKNAENNS